MQTFQRYYQDCTKSHLVNGTGMDLEQNCFKLFTIAGALSIGYLCLKFAFKVCHALRVYAFKTYPDFSKYGKWSGKWFGLFFSS